MHYLALGLEYDGHAFHGFQTQVDIPTVQAELELALSQVANEKIRLVTAGRTDAGVHASGQVISFSSSAQRPLDAWIRGTNSLTSNAISILWARNVDQKFSARFSALSRRYLYVWHRADQRGALARNLVCHTDAKLDEKRMHAAVQVLLGEHDFTSFRAAGCQSRTAQREVLRIKVCRFGETVVLDITANAFLQHMVRNIAGSLYQIGISREPVQWLAHLLALRDRTLAAATARPEGLYMVEVEYPQAYNFPDPSLPIVLHHVEI